MQLHVSAGAGLASSIGAGREVGSHGLGSIPSNLIGQTKAWTHRGSWCGRGFHEFRATWLPVSKGRHKAAANNTFHPRSLPSGPINSLPHAPRAAPARVSVVAAHRQPGFAFVSAPSHFHDHSTGRHHDWSAAISTNWALRTRAGTLPAAQQSSSAQVDAQAAGAWPMAAASRDRPHWRRCRHSRLLLSLRLFRTQVFALVSTLQAAAAAWHWPAAAAAACGACAGPPRGWRQQAHAASRGTRGLHAATGEAWNTVGTSWLAPR